MLSLIYGSNIEYRLTFEPTLVDTIVHVVAKPRRGKHLRHLSGSLFLFLLALYHPWLNDIFMFSCNQFRRDMLKKRIAIAQRSVVIRCPEDVLARGAVKEESFKYLMPPGLYFIFFYVYTKWHP